MTPVTIEVERIIEVHHRLLTKKRITVPINDPDTDQTEAVVEIEITRPTTEVSYVIEISDTCYSRIGDVFMDADGVKWFHHSAYMLESEWKPVRIGQSFKAGNNLRLVHVMSTFKEG
jgi:hypothetical protein